MFCAFKYRLEPNAHQRREIEITLETHHRLYNACLQQRRDEYEQHRHSVKYTDQSRWFKQERQTNAYFARLNFSSAQATMRRLDRAFQAFFRRAKAGETPGYPRFKSRDRFDSFTYASLGDGALKLTGNKIRLQHIGVIRVNLHRPWGGRIKTVTIHREVDKWFVVRACETDDVLPVPRHGGAAVGLDVGIESFVTTSDGEQIAPVQPLKRKLKKLRVAQRRLSRRKRNGQNRRKQRRQVARVHAHVANTRRDLHHKTARDLVDRYGLIAVESLNIQGMSRNHRLARAILDAGWSRFIEILGHKAESAGARVMAVDPRGTSQTCSECGATVRKTLGERWHSCVCGYSAHRDRNAARNILARALTAGTQPVGLNVDVGLHGQRSRRLWRRSVTLFFLIP